MGISPCFNLATATSPGQAPLPSPPSKCKLTADKAYGAIPALRASVFIRENGKGTLSEVLTKERHDEEERDEDEVGGEGGGEQTEGAESAHLIIGDPRPELPIGRPPRWIALATNDLAADDQSGNQVPEG